VPLALQQRPLPAGPAHELSTHSARFVRIGEKPGRLLRANKNQMANTGERSNRLVDRIRQERDGAGTLGLFHETSDGRISVATPLALRAAATAAAASPPTISAERTVRVHTETGRAQPSMSEVSGASKTR
jgi:hypothetical protein